MRKRTYTRKQAVALRYAEEDRAPKVVASGPGELAKRILDLAAQHNIPVHRDGSLVAVLAKLDVESEIPPETYRAVAEILAFLYRTDAAWRKKKEQEHSGFAGKQQCSPSPAEPASASPATAQK